MPISRYFKGHGNEVMDSMMKSNHGDAKAAKSEFYATANARKMKPADEKPKKKSFGRRVAGK